MNVTTTFVERFCSLMEMMCVERPPDKMVQEWFDGTDDDSLQQFAVEHGPDYIQGIALIDGITTMAEQPREGEGHELRKPQAEQDTNCTCYSIDDEDFCYSDIDGVLDALNEAGILAEGACYFKATSRQLLSKNILNASYILEDADERGYNIIGDEWKEPFLNTDDRAENELQTLLDAWSAKHVNLNSYYEIVGTTHMCYVTKEDLEKFNSR